MSAASPRGLHLPADVFYTFPAHPISPVLPEAQQQNEAMIAPANRAAAAFAVRGYEVFLDGIVGPWFLPVVADELRSTGLPVEYVVLQVSLEQAIQRATSRSEPGPEPSSGTCTPYFRIWVWAPKAALCVRRPRFSN